MDAGAAASSHRGGVVSSGAMAPGRCPSCSEPYSPQDVAVYGVLRARTAQRGGPRIEYRCPRCRRIVHLIPLGQGRFARPGEPPPPPADDPPRAPWADRSAPETRAADADEEGVTTPEEGGTAPRDEPTFDRPTVPTDLAKALELLGLDAAASVEEVHAAWRRKAVSCHPDKVAHLDADFRLLADRKFRALSEAREIALAGLPPRDAGPRAEEGPGEDLG